MFVCRVCGTESDSAVCPMCGALNTEVGSGAQQDRKEKIARPPAPKNQPALLRDASPVFDPSAPAASPEEIKKPAQQQQRPAQNAPADKADPLHRNAFTRPRRPVVNPQAAQSLYRPEQPAQNQPAQPVYQQPAARQPAYYQPVQPPVQQPSAQQPVWQPEATEPVREREKPVIMPETNETPVIAEEEMNRPQPERQKPSGYGTTEEKSPPQKKPANGSTTHKKKKPKPKPPVEKKPEAPSPITPEDPAAPAEPEPPVEKTAPEPESKETVIAGDTVEEAVWGTETEPEKKPEETEKKSDEPEETAGESDSRESISDEPAETDGAEVEKPVETAPEEPPTAEETPAAEESESTPEDEADDEYDEYVSSAPDGAADDAPEHSGEDEPAEPQITEEAEKAAKKNGIAVFKADLRRSGKLAAALTGSSLADAAELMLDESRGYGLSLLIPAHLAAIVLAGLCGWRAGGESGVFSGAGSSIGAAALAWLEHIVILSILTAMVFISIKKPKNAARVVTMTMTALLPLCASTVPALAAAFLLPALTVPFLAVGAGWSLILLYSVLDKAGLTGKKRGTLRTAAFMLVYILAIGFLAGQFI